MLTLARPGAPQAPRCCRLRLPRLAGGLGRGPRSESREGWVGARPPGGHGAALALAGGGGVPVAAPRVPQVPQVPAAGHRSCTHLGLPEHAGTATAATTARGRAGTYEEFEELEDAFVGEDVERVPGVGVDDGQAVDLVADQRGDGVEEAAGAAGGGGWGRGLAPGAPTSSAPSPPQGGTWRWGRCRPAA